MKRNRVLAAVIMLVLVAAAIPIARSWATDLDAPARSHEWELSKVSGPTSLTLTVGQQIRISHKVKLSVILHTDSDWTAGRAVEVDECATISDADAGDIGGVCAGATPVIFDYSVRVGPYEACGRYEHEVWWPKMLIRSKTRCSGRVIPLGYRG